MDNPSKSSDSTATGNRDHHLHHLHNLSHKICKTPSLRPFCHDSVNTRSVKCTSDGSDQPPQSLCRYPIDRPPPPPVYNISKKDFSHVVQQLTGSPAHVPASTPKPPSSRLQRHRPPPLAEVSTRPPPLSNCAAGGFLSPLPPLPTCHAAAESPISAYLRFLHRADSISAVDSDPSSATAPAPAPSSPVLLGFMPWPKSPCALLSSGLVFSPAGMGPLGFPQLPVSPTVPSPK